jgi:uncharacterized protein (DUF2267 family)
MEELVALVSKKTGLSQMMAQVAVNVVLDYLKKKLPVPIAAQLAAFLNNPGQVTITEQLIGGLVSKAGQAAKKKKKTTKK